MTNEKIKKVLEKHGIESHMANNRIYAHSYEAGGAYEMHDLTGMSLKRLLIYLGY